MKRLSLALMTVLILTALDDSHVGPSLAQADLPPILEVSISGASGRSVHKDTENLVVFWWTAPATGTVTFDTAGSDLDTLLGVYVYEIDSPGEVASNDDADDGTSQSAVRFTALKGLGYGIIIDDYFDWERTGTIVLNWQLEPLRCDGPRPPVVDLRGGTLRGIVLDDHVSLHPHVPTAYILVGQNASIVYWFSQLAGYVTSSLYVSMDGSESVRTFYDANGYPHKVRDECSGNWMRIHNYGGDAVDVWFYDADGTPLYGLALFEWDGQYYYGEIIDEPIYAGEYAIGESETTSGIARYELYVEPPEVTNIRPVPAQIAALIDALSQDGTKSTGLSFPGSRSRLAAALRPLGALLSPRVAHAAVPGGGDLLQTGGALVAGVGLLSGIVAGAVSAPLLIAGGAAYMAGHVLNIIHDEANERLGADMDVNDDGDMLGLSIDHLTGTIGRGLGDFVRGVKDWIVHKKTNARDKIDRGKQARRSLVFEPNPPDFPEYSPIFDDKASPFRRGVQGHGPREVVTGSWTVGGTTVPLSGSISTNGSLQATDSSGDIVLTGAWYRDGLQITHNQQPLRDGSGDNSNRGGGSDCGGCVGDGCGCDR